VVGLAGTGGRAAGGALGVDALTVQGDLNREVRAQLAGLAEFSLGARR
jgi:hypothetical protein